MRGVCELLDEGDPQRHYATALEAQAAKVREVALTPAARTLEEMRTNEESFFNFALRMSKLHKSYFLELHSPNEARQDEFAAEADESLRAQARIEAADRIGFDEYLARYPGGFTVGFVRRGKRHAVTSGGQGRDFLRVDPRGGAGDPCPQSPQPRREDTTPAPTSE